MTRSDLVAQLAERFGQLTHRDTEFAVKTILDAMSDALARGHRIEIRGFGSFSINRRPPRVGRNPRSGEQVVIPEKLVPHFKPGKALREAVDAQRAGAERGEPASSAAEPPRTRPLAAPDRARRRIRRAAMRIARLARSGPPSSSPVRLRAEQPAGGRRPLVLRPASGTRRWSSSCSPRSASAARSACFAMVPSWWRHRRVARNAAATRRRSSRVVAAAAPPPPARDRAELHPPRDGL